MQCGAHVRASCRRSLLSTAVPLGTTHHKAQWSAVRFSSRRAGRASTPHPPAPPSPPPSPLTTYHQLVPLAARNEWTAALALMVTPSATTTRTTGEKVAGGGETMRTVRSAVTLEHAISLLLFYNHMDGARAVWQAAERAALEGTSRLPLDGRGLILQFAAYALLVERAPERARDVLLLDTWLSRVDDDSTTARSPDPIAETTAWTAPLVQLLEAFVQTRATDELSDNACKVWQSALEAAVSASSGAQDRQDDYRTALACLTRLHAHPEHTGLTAYRDLVRNALVPLQLVAADYPFLLAGTSTDADRHGGTAPLLRDGKEEKEEQEEKEEGKDEEKEEAAAVRHRWQLQCAMDVGDWVQALRLIHAPLSSSSSSAMSPLHALRVSLTACEAACTPGSAWCGALWAWNTAVPLCAAAPILPHPSAQGRTQGRRQTRPTSSRTGQAESRPALTRKEAGRVLTILAHAGRGVEAVDLFDTLPAALVDAYNVIQVAFAVTTGATVRRTRSTGPAQDAAPPSPELLRLWASWRGKVGDAVAPTSRLVAAMIRCGVRSTAEDGHAVVALVTMGARQALSPRTAGGRATGESIPIDFEASEKDIAVLLRDRWDGSWQEALQVAVASQRPGLFEVVVQKSSPHQAIYRAAQGHIQDNHDGGDGGGGEVSAEQRVALVAHLHAGKTVRTAVTAAEDPSVTGEATPPLAATGAPKAVDRHRRDVDWVSTMLDQLLGKDGDTASETRVDVESTPGEEGGESEKGGKRGVSPSDRFDM